MREKEFIEGVRDRIITALDEVLVIAKRRDEPDAFLHVAQLGGQLISEYEESHDKHPIGFHAVGAEVEDGDDEASGPIAE